MAKYSSMGPSASCNNSSSSSGAGMAYPRYYASNDPYHNMGYYAKIYGPRSTDTPIGYGTTVPDPTVVSHDTQHVRSERPDSSAPEPKTRPCARHSAASRAAVVPPPAGEQIVFCEDKYTIRLRQLAALQDTVVTHPARRRTTQELMAELREGSVEDEPAPRKNRGQDTSHQMVAPIGWEIGLSWWMSD